MSTPQTPTLNFGFYGTIHLAGYNARAIWDTAVAAIARATMHHNHDDIEAWLDSSDGQEFADFMADELQRGCPVRAAVNSAVQYWMGKRPDDGMVRQLGVTVDTPYLIAVLWLIADWK